MNVIRGEQKVTTSRQLINRHRLQRRFSSGDGVRLPDGREGVIKGHSTSVEQGFEAMVAPQDGADWVLVLEKDLVSVPALNTGKYGGPQRGGAPGGWVGGNNYRQRGRR